MKKFIKNNGITLVALVVTIVVLLILAGVSISLVLGDNGLISQAKQSANATKEAVENDYNMLEKLESQIADFSSEYNKVNKPKLKTGMTPVYFVENGSTYETKTTNESDSNWYDYEAKHWANAQTADGSMWVWIPRFAYKLNNDNKTFDVKFLIETTDYFYNDKGELEKATRATADSSPDTTKEYAVHPAFANESNIGFRDGGWDSELTGIWVAKFEAGYADVGTQAETTETYTQTVGTIAGAELESGKDTWTTTRNIYGAYDATTKMTYPLFQGLKISYNYISNGVAYTLCKAMTNENNIYGFSSDTDSHMMKNSEWGACAYLGQSQYGLNGTNIYINNVNINSSTKSGYAVTGVCGINESNNTYSSNNNTITLDNIRNNTAKNVKLWNTEDGTNSSSTGTVYGIYDLSGGLWERTTAYIANNNSNLSYGKSFTNWTNTSAKYNTTSSKYYTVYEYQSYEGSDYDIASTNNWTYNKNLATKKYGDAVLETSQKGIGSNSSAVYYGDYSIFTAIGAPFFLRGGGWDNGGGAGLFAFDRTYGFAYYDYGFRAVLV